MIEALGPLVSLFRLFLEGLTKVTQSADNSYKRGVQRKILELQLSLQDVIDNGLEILATIFPSNTDRRPLDEDAIRRFTQLVYAQRRAIATIAEQLCDENLKDIMGLFTPETRRSIGELVHMKGGVIDELLDCLLKYTEAKERGQQLTVEVNTAVLTWNHDRFVAEGHSYTRFVFRARADTNISLLQRLEEQQPVLRELVQCSNRLSEFISKHFDLDTVIGIRRTR